MTAKEMFKQYFKSAHPTGYVNGPQLAVRTAFLAAHAAQQVTIDEQAGEIATEPTKCPYCQLAALQSENERLMIEREDYKTASKGLGELLAEQKLVSKQLRARIEALEKELAEADETIGYCGIPQEYHDAKARGRSEAFAECVEIIDSLDIDPVGMDSNGGITNAQNSWAKGSMDTIDAVIDAIKAKGGIA